MSAFDTWTASSMMHKMLLVILSLSSGPVWFQDNGKLTSSLYVDTAWPVTFTFMQWYYKLLLSLMVEPVCCFKSKYSGLLCWKLAYADNCGRFRGKKYGVWYWHFDLNLGISWISQTAHDALVVQHHGHCLPANILGLDHAVIFMVGHHQKALDWHS